MSYQNGALAGVFVAVGHLIHLFAQIHDFVVVLQALQFRARLQMFSFLQQKRYVCTALPRASYFGISDSTSYTVTLGEKCSLATRCLGVIS
jgi:hypothetical protein